MNNITANELVEKLDLLPEGSIVVVDPPSCGCGDPAVWCRIVLEEIAVGLKVMRYEDYRCLSCLS